MRIAYIAHYQGPSLVSQRPCLHNLSLAIKVKIELIAELLKRNSHDIEILAQGEVDRYQLRFYPALNEKERFHPEIPIYYASAVPVRYVNGFWSGNRTTQLLKARHQAAPFDLVILHNMKRAHLAAARYARRRLGLPIVLEYEDDSFVDVAGREPNGLTAKFHARECREALKGMSGCMAVSPYLLSQLPAAVPKLLLRGVVSDAVINSNHQPRSARKNWVVFSGTHEGTQGLEQMIRAWRTLKIPGWELHLAGRGSITADLEKLAEGDRSIVFHGYLNRQENAQLLCSAKIGMNPQDVSVTLGNVFAFKIIEYLAAGLHVVTTPRGILEPELEAGITYIQDNRPETIGSCLKQMITGNGFDKIAQEAALDAYGPQAISEALNKLVIDARSCAVCGN